MNLLKLGTGIAGFTGVSGAGALGVYYFRSSSINENTIVKKLKRNNWVVLGNSEKEHRVHWSTSLSKYKIKHPNNDGLTEDKLKEICKGLLNTEDDKNYEEARRYCVIPRKISERLGDLSFSILNITTDSSSNNPNQPQWTALATKYKTKGIGSKELDSLKADTINDNGANWTSLKDKCKGVVDKDHWSDDYDLLVDNSKTWCTLQGFNDLDNV